MKKEVIKLLVILKCTCFIFILLRLYEAETKSAYAATDTKITGVTASASSEYWMWPASGAVDDVDAETWWSTNIPGPCWIQLTFDKVYYIDRWYVKNFGYYSDYQPGADAFNTRDYILQGSMDGTSWTDIDVVNDNTLDITNRTVTPFTAKYVRIYIVHPIQDEISTTGCGAIVDFEVFAAAPVVTSVAAPASNTYKGGQNLTFTVNYSADVTVMGSPYIPVTIGSKTINAEYVGGTGTSALTFRYTVQPGDYDENEIELGTNINANGGSIRDFAYNDANPALNNVEATPGIVVDARINHSIVIPSFTSGTIAADQTSEVVGETVTLTITPASGYLLKTGSLKYNDGSNDYVITGTSFTMPDSNITISAVFEDVLYTVDFGSVTSGNIAADKTTAVKNETVNLTITPDSGTQLKAGSLKYNDGTNEIVIIGTSFTMPAANVTITAEFEDLPDTILIGSFFGGTITADKATAKKNETVNLTISPDSGKQLKGGSLKYYDGTQYVDITGTSFTMPDSNVTISAEFESKRYTVQFNPNWTVIVPSVEVSYDEKITSPTVDTPGVRQDGWYTDSTFATAWNFSTDSVQQNMTLYLKYTPIGNVAFNSNGGDTVNSQTIGRGEKVQEPVGVNKTGFILDGWYLTSDSSGARYDFNSNATSTEINQMRTLYAKWVPLYSISMDVAVGGSITANPVVSEAGDTISLMITPYTGKQLKAGSLKYNDGANEIAISGTSFIMPAANVTVIAEFEDSPVIPTVPMLSYTVTVGTVTGGSISASSTVAVSGSSITLLITPDSGKQLKAGSLKCSEGANNVIISGSSFTMPAANVIITAEFEDTSVVPIPAPTYTVTIETLTGGSITANPTTAQVGETITLTITPDSGKQLKAGSLKYNDGTQEVAITGTSFVMPTANVTVTAEFEDIPVPSTDTNLISIGTPALITGLMNGTAKSAAAMGLPATVSIITSGGSNSASVVWNVASCTYNQYSLSAQSFTVTGSLTLPSGVVNTNNVNLSVTISVSVNQGTNQAPNTDINNNNSNNNSNNTNTNTSTDTNLPRVEGSKAEGWDSITQYIADNNTGSITVDMNGETTVAQEVFEAARGKDIDLTLDIGNGIEWIINGTDIPESTDASRLHGIDFNLSMNTDSIPTELLEALSGTEKVQISLEYDGSFGFTATLKLPMEEKYKGKFANLFYYNPVTNQLELQAVGVVNENGTVEFPFTHASDYVIVMNNTAMLDDAIKQIAVIPEMKTLYMGGTKGGSASIKTVIPEVVQKAVTDGLCEMSITYKSSNPKVVAISGSGKIIAKKVGTVTITTTIKVNGVEKSYQTTIKVKKAYIKIMKSIKIMKLGETYTFQVTGYGVDANDVIFTTFKKSIVTINKHSGEAIAKSVGTDYVIAKAGNVEVKIKVVVQE